MNVDETNKYAERHAGSPRHLQYQKKRQWPGWKGRVEQEVLRRGVRDGVESQVDGVHWWRTSVWAHKQTTPLTHAARPETPGRRAWHGNKCGEATEQACEHTNIRTEILVKYRFRFVL
jgi:hypothetical protein